MRPFSEMASPYFKFNRTRNLLNVLTKKRGCVALRSRIWDLRKSRGRMSEKEEVAAKVCEIS